MAGELFIVATPIGHMSDITFRAVETLKEVDFILAEDTRETHKILERYTIDTVLVSYRDQNHDKMMPKVLEKLQMGMKLALVSDSGTPTISDPGYKLVKDVKEAGYNVMTIPGPSAVISALSVSGLPTDKFVFLGFLPKSDVRRIKMLQKYSELDATVVVYESPHRLLKLLDNILEVVGEDRLISVSNNLTKRSELTFTGTVKECIAFGNDNGVKGEFVVSISKV